MRIDTKRLIIKEFNLDMASDVHLNSLDDDIKRFVPDEYFETKKIAYEVVGELIEAYSSEKGPFVYPVLLKDGTNIGYVEACLIEDGKYEIGYHIAKRYTSLGYATEAVKAFIPYIMNKLKINEIYGVLLSDNIASYKVLIKCGFVEFFRESDLYQGAKRDIVKLIFKKELGALNMRLLFTIDTKDYDINGTVFSRPSVRSIIIKNNKIAMMHSIKLEYYKFPGGGMENNESYVETLKRETLEEAGLNIIEESIKPFGYVHRIQKGDFEDVFIQDNYYYLCDVKDEIQKQKLDDYEQDEMFTLEFVDPFYAIEYNNNCKTPKTDFIMIERENRVLKLLIEEGYLNEANK